MLPESSGNGGSSGPGGVMQLINGPGLATGGAWAPPPNGGRQRTVNFNYNFGNLDRLLGVLNPQPLRRYTVESAVITVFPSEAGGEPHAGDLSAKFHGNARSLNWSDSVTDSSPLAGQAFASRWSIELRLTGQRSGVVTTDSRPFDVRVHCLLPVQQ
jgi:hypothetical protein